MDRQSINDQLELLRLKELFISDIEIRSQMAAAICKGSEEPSPYHSFCELTQCKPTIAKHFAGLMMIELWLTPEEIKSERERLNRMLL